MEDIKDKLVAIESGPTHVIASLPPSQDTTPDQIAFFQRPSSIPFIRHSPLPVAASAPTNAVAKTIAKEVVASTPVAPAAAADVNLIMPAQYSVTESTSGTTEEIDVAWLPVPAGYALMGPGPITALESINSIADAASGVNLSTLPQSTSSWALFVEYSNNNLVSGQPVGWTQLSSTASQNVFYKTQSGLAAYLAVASLSAPTSVTAATLIFSGPVPPIVQSIPQVIVGSSGSVTMAPITAGNVIFAIVQAYNGGNNYAFSVTDTQGNEYFLVNSEAIGAGANLAITQAIYICPSALSSGANSIGFNFYITGSSAPDHKEVFVMETGPLTPGPGLPFFRQIVPSDLPSLGDFGGIIPLALGGTGANLNTTGGTSKVVKQSSAGAAFTVGLVDYSDLSGNLASATLTTSAPTVAAGQVGIGSDTSTSATAGTNGAVPAQVVGYLTINVAGTNMKIPYFNT